jgi:hypothetical protein
MNPYQSPTTEKDQARPGFLQRPNGPLAMGTPAKPVLGLPVRRVIPQDVHSVLDYAGSLTDFAAMAIADSPKAKAAAGALGIASLGVSLLTDYRLSVAKVIPIEVHEAIDYLWGAANIATPFVLGYDKKDPVACTLQVATGVLTIVASLFTDYRAARGVQWFGAPREQISARA